MAKKKKKTVNPKPVNRQNNTNNGGIRTRLNNQERDSENASRTSDKLQDASGQGMGMRSRLNQEQPSGRSNETSGQGGGIRTRLNQSQEPERTEKSSAQGSGVRSRYNQNQESERPEKSSAQGSGARSRYSQSQKSERTEKSSAQGSGVRSRYNQSQESERTEKSSAQGSGVRSRYNQSQASEGSAASQGQGGGIRSHKNQSWQEERTASGSKHSSGGKKNPPVQKNLKDRKKQDKAESKVVVYNSNTDYPKKETRHVQASASTYKRSEKAIQRERDLKLRDEELRRALKKRMDNRADRHSHSLRSNSTAAEINAQESEIIAAVQQNKAKTNNTNNKSKTGSTSKKSAAKSSADKKTKKKKKIWPRVVLVIIALIAVFAVVVLLNVGSLRTQAKNLKNELQTAVACVENKDMDSLYETVDRIDNNIKDMQDSVNNPLWEFMTYLPYIGGDVKTVQEVAMMLSDVSEDILHPLVDVVKENPLDGLKTGNGYNVNIIMNYLDFAESLVPEIKEYADRVANMDITASVGGIDEYMGRLEGLLDTYSQLENYFPLLKAILNTNEDRTYLLAAQNSAELRAAGGFPGSVGLITIRDGILEIGDFQSVYNVFESDVPGGLGVTDLEVKIFTESVQAWAHDQTYNPDFERVGEIWCKAYQDKNREELNGVISLTPVIVQKLLESTGKSITLSDGTVVDGTNATKVIEHDLYQKYLSNDETLDKGNEIADSLFAETVKSVMGIATENLDVSVITAILNILIEGKNDRTVLMYMDDSSEERIVEDCGFSGRLNYDKNVPKAGIYFSLADPSKLGWYIDINAEIINSQKLESGETEYTIDLSISNNLPEDEKDESWYVVGNYEGSAFFNLHLFAPAGGEIYDIRTYPEFDLEEESYEKLGLYYALGIFVEPGSTLSVEYKITTPGGIDAPLSFDMTPTLQKYREQAEQ